jgi:hypothetical protein
VGAPASINTPDEDPELDPVDPEEDPVLDPEEDAAPEDDPAREPEDDPDDPEDDPTPEPPLPPEPDDPPDPLWTMVVVSLPQAERGTPQAAPIAKTQTKLLSRNARETRLARRIRVEFMAINPRELFWPLFSRGIPSQRLRRRARALSRRARSWSGALPSNGGGKRATYKDARYKVARSSRVTGRGLPR